MNFQNPIITDALLDLVIDGVPGRSHGIHGLHHWLRVERNGLYLSLSSGADSSVVSLFALFHDARRVNDGADPGHGARGARLVEELFRNNEVPISEDQLETLAYACANHTDEDYSGDITIATCWDADRLDLPRVGVTPDPELLNTHKAKEIAGSQDLQQLDGFVYAEFASI